MALYGWSFCGKCHTQSSERIEIRVGMNESWKVVLETVRCSNPPSQPASGGVAKHVSLVI
eukprot:m.67923 g.67923  ORF g.67923 m.67923 type:complete len:60 (-) comp9889_c0_seq1:1945-2124(-)